MVVFPLPPIEHEQKWLYQLLPIKYELKFPSEITPGLLQFRSKSNQCEKQLLQAQILESGLTTLARRIGSDTSAAAAAPRNGLQTAFRDPTAEAEMVVPTSTNQV